MAKLTKGRFDINGEFTGQFIFEPLQAPKKV